MDCPFCKRAMLEGKLHRRWATTRSGDGDYFIGPDGAQTEIGEYTRNDALQCEDCGTIILKGRFA